MLNTHLSLEGATEMSARYKKRVIALFGIERTKEMVANLGLMLPETDLSPGAQQMSVANDVGNCGCATTDDFCPGITNPDRACHAQDETVCHHVYDCGWFWEAYCDGNCSDAT